MKKIIAVLTSILVVLICPTSFAEDGVALFKIDHGARLSGMGGTSFSIDKDPNAAVYNPALAMGFDKFSASFGHTEFWENIRLESGYLAVNVTPKLAIHAGIRYATVSDLEGRTFPSSQPQLMFDAHDISFKGGAAYQISPKLDVGFGVGWIIEKIDGYRGSAFNVDLGAVTHVNPNIDLGASVTSLGSDFKLEQTGIPGSNDIKLPTVYRIGGSYKYQRYLGSAEMVYLDDQAHAHFGAEAALTEIFSFRTGYMLNYDTKNFTAGASFSHRNITVDYAFIPFSRNLGTTHLFNLTFSL
jgi:hypothetical protein